MTSTHYLALTIGPIYKTIQRARKTRELWASSYLLSQFMRLLLTEIQAAGIGTVLSPNLANLKEQNDNNVTWHGAGVWNDNCFFELTLAQVAVAKDKLPGIIQKAKSDLFNIILLDIETDKDWNGPASEYLRKVLARHFHCHAAIWECKGDDPILATLGSLTHSVEMLDLYPNKDDDFVSKAMFRGKTVKGLYNLGFADGDEVFTYYTNRFDKLTTERRMPSLLEIGLRQYRKDKDFYDSKIAAIISKNSQESDDVETEQEEKEMITLLKGEENTTGIKFKKRHKYVAVVQADGDGIGTMITKAKDKATIEGISESMMKFSTGAVEKIFEYDGLPVYAGGDDLFFLAPLWNKEDKTIFQLLEDIEQEWKDAELPEGASVSFGVSIFYYKDPLGEILQNARLLLNGVAKQLISGSHENPTKKNALAFRVMMHSGQAFATVLHKQGNTWSKWNDLMKKHATSQQDATFVAGVVYTLERLGWLLEDACTKGRTQAFFDHHFNEAKGDQKLFIADVRALAEAIHSDYGTLFPGTDLEQDSRFETTAFFAGLQQDNKQDGLTHGTQFRNNLLYAALRMIQFLNAEDHE